MTERIVTYGCFRCQPIYVCPVNGLNNKPDPNRMEYIRLINYNPPPGSAIDYNAMANRHRPIIGYDFRHKPVELSEEDRKDILERLEHYTNTAESIWENLLKPIPTKPLKLIAVVDENLVGGQIEPYNIDLNLKPIFYDPINYQVPVTKPTKD